MGGKFGKRATGNNNSKAVRSNRGGMLRCEKALENYVGHIKGKDDSLPYGLFKMIVKKQKTIC